MEILANRMNQMEERLSRIKDKVEESDYSVKESVKPTQTKITHPGKEHTGSLVNH